MIKNLTVINLKANSHTNPSMGDVFVLKTCQRTLVMGIGEAPFLHLRENALREDIITDIFEYCSNEVPKWNTISISGYHIREAGSTAVQELAFTLANGKAYLNAALQKGLDINVFAKRLSFFFNCHNNFFEEIAKFRAARRMWANIVKDLGATTKLFLYLPRRLQKSPCAHNRLLRLKAG